MPISHQLDEPRRLVQSTACGIISRQDVLEHLEAKVAAQLIDYPEIFDARNVTLDLSVHDLQEIAEKLRLATEGRPLGPIALITNNRFVRSLGETYIELTRHHGRLFGIFATVAEAQDWLRDPKPAVTS